MRPEEVLKDIESVAPREGLPIIGPKRGLILDKVVEEHHPSRVLEVGTLVGYSAIRIGRHLKKGELLTCVEISEQRARTARSNIEKSGLSGLIEVKVGDARKLLPALKGEFDMVFLDAVKEDYFAYLKSVEHLLHPGSVVVADNVKSHASEMAPYLEYVRNSGRYKSTYVDAPSNYGTDTGDAVEVSVKL